MHTTKGPFPDDGDSCRISAHHRRPRHPFKTCARPHAEPSHVERNPWRTLVAKACTAGAAKARGTDVHFAERGCVRSKKVPDRSRASRPTIRDRRQVGTGRRRRRSGSEICQALLNSVPSSSRQLVQSHRESPGRPLALLNCSACSASARGTRDIPLILGCVQSLRVCFEGNRKAGSESSHRNQDFAGPRTWADQTGLLRKERATVLMTHVRRRESVGVCASCASRPAYSSSSLVWLNLVSARVGCLVHHFRSAPQFRSRFFSSCVRLPPTLAARSCASAWR